MYHVQPAGEVSLVIGAGNSACQSVMAFAEEGRVHHIIRSEIKASEYLRPRLKNNHNITTHMTCKVDVITRPSFAPERYRIGIINDKHQLTYVHCDKIYFIASAHPPTAWLKGSVDLDDEGFIKTRGLKRQCLVSLQWETIEPAKYVVS